LEEIFLLPISKNSLMRCFGRLVAGMAVSLPLKDFDTTPNCVSAVKFLEKFNKGEMQYTGKKIVCVVAVIPLSTWYPYLVVSAR